jgi:hypothetical protein
MNKDNDRITMLEHVKNHTSFSKETAANILDEASKIDWTPAFTISGKVRLSALRKPKFGKLEKVNKKP